MKELSTPGKKVSSIELMEIIWAGRWNVAEDNEESEVVAIELLEALARKSSDTMKELLYNWNSLSKTLFSLTHTRTHVKCVAKETLYKSFSYRRVRLQREIA